MNRQLIWFNGQLIPKDKALISIFSPTAQYGVNVFEGIRCYWNAKKGSLYGFRVKEHLDRLIESCRIIGIVSRYSKDEIISLLKHVIQANEFKEDIAIRITIFVDGEGSWHSIEPVSMFIAPFRKPRSNLLQIHGLKAAVSSWFRINDNVLPPRAKVGANYMNSRYAYIQAQKDGYDLPIFLGQDGKVAESSGACLMTIRNGVLSTPPIYSSILESITRDTIIQLAREEGMIVSERIIDRTELYLADEVFICGSAAEITPIVMVDRFIIGSGSPGPITLKLLDKYHSIVTGEDERHPEWRTELYRDNTSDAN